MSEIETSWIYPEGSGIRIRQKVNTSGLDPFGVSFQVDVPTKITGGKRIRRQYKDKDEAEAFANKQFNGSRKEGEAYFRATDQERRAFTDAIPKLREAGVSLDEAVEFALARMKPAGGDRNVKQVVEELLIEKRSSFERGNLTAQSVETFETRSNIITSKFGGVLLKDLTLPMVTDWLKGFKKANRTLKNYMVCLGEILNHGKRNKYVNENILDALSKTQRRELYGDTKETQPGILTPDEAKRLINAAYANPDLGLAAAVTFGLFCGLRTEEIMKLDWSAVDLERGIVTIDGSIAKKRRLRNTTIPENAKAFLQQITVRQGKIVNFKDRYHFFYTFNNLLIKAGFVYPNREKTKKRRLKTKWKRNAMRHSFGSYHYALHEDSIKTSNELGHRQGDNVLFAHYRALTTKEQGEAYFNILPEPQTNQS